MSKCINLDATRSALVASPPILTMSHDHLRPCTTGRHVHAPTPPHATPTTTPLLRLWLLTTPMQAPNFVVQIWKPKKQI
ncbi:hypothetical protein JHK87_031231 [Glycine soja]|nr:hypothetical protein JHK87_031231 [Glycine soja]